MKRLVTHVLTLSATAALALNLGAGAVVAAPQSGAASSAPRTTENSKLNKVTTPRLSWFNCYGSASCATAKLPLDYDNPKGKTTNVAVLRTPATGRRIGTLFVNPGGPGGSSTEMALFADEWLSPEVREKFDVVGVDPRGIGFSDQVQCLPVEQQNDVNQDLAVAFPMGWTQEQKYIQSTRRVARACSKNPLATSMSTAEVARDMEMVRRALGQRKLSYLGFSYGSHLGTTYANMFPGNFRSIVVDGTLDPYAWSGTRQNQSKPLDFRLESGKGAWRAMRQILDECRKAGGERCEFATTGNPRTKFDAMAAQLKKKPVRAEDPFTGERFTLTYADFVGSLLYALYASDSPQFVDMMLSEFEMLVPPSGAAARRATPTATPTERQRIYAAIRSQDQPPRRGFTYDNSLDSLLSVTCTDSRETTKIANYPAYARQSDTRAPHFGRAWLWGTAGCAGDTFTGQDEDAYVGPYNRPTTKAVLVVGNYWDPATNYQGAVSTRNILGRARLVSSDSWGHTAYGVSTCVTGKVDSYFLDGRSPRTDSTCPAESEAFPQDDEEFPESVPQILEQKKMPRGKSLGQNRGFPAPSTVR